MTSQTPLKSASGPQLASRAYTETESEIPELHPRPFGTLYSATFISAVTVPTLTHPHAGTAFATCPEQQRQCDLSNTQISPYHFPEYKLGIIPYCPQAKAIVTGSRLPTIQPSKAFSYW